MCNDTHIMNDKGWMCTRCPTPCQECRGRAGGYAPFCETTPCSCLCHRNKPFTPYHDTKLVSWPEKSDAEIMEWYQGPLTKLRLAQLRYKLAKCRGLLVSLMRLETDDEELVPYTE